MKLNVFFALILSVLAFAGLRLSASEDSNGQDFSVSVTGKVTAVDSTSVTVLGLKIALPPGLVVTSNGNCGGDHGGDHVRKVHGNKKDHGGNNGNHGGNNNGDNGGNNGNHGGGNGGGNDGNNGNHGGNNGGNNGENGGDNNGDDNNGNNGNHGGGDDNDDGDCNGNNSGPIAVGNFIKVELPSDATPLTAAAIHDWGGYGEGYRLKAPVQAVTSNGNVVTVTVLGLVVDVSTAHFEGCNDDDSETKPLTLADLAVGQNVELTLDASKLPALVATHIKIRKATNEVDIDTGHSSGDLDSDLTIDASQTATGTDPTTGKRVKKTIKLHTVTRSTKFALRGFFPGKARIVYSYKGHKHSAGVKIAANGTTNLKLRLGK